MVEADGQAVVIDAGPDFRQQMLAAKVQSIDAILLTHEHNDHVIGLDDVRPFNFSMGRDMPIYGREHVLQDVKDRFGYAFQEGKYYGTPKMALMPIRNLEPFEINNLRVIPIEVLHGRLPILGFRIGDFGYITDAKSITDSEFEKLRGCEVLILNALREKEHVSHLSLDEALDWIAKLQPKTAYLTHLSHLMGPTSIWEQKLPPNVFPAQDNMKIELS